jgi:hypothetical protein
MDLDSRSYDLFKMTVLGMSRQSYYVLCVLQTKESRGFTGFLTLLLCF